MFQESISKKSDKELIFILENPEDYVEQFLDSAKIEFRKRDISREVSTTIAEAILRKKCQDLFAENLFQFELFDIPESNFLDESERTRLFKEELSKFQKKRRALNSGLPTGRD